MVVPVSLHTNEELQSNVAKMVPYIKNGTLCVKVNDTMGKYFGSFKGVRHAAECLYKMIRSGQHNGVFAGLISHLIDTGVAILQYADDTIILLEDDLEMARNLKLVLYLFESMSGLKINFLKSELTLINCDDQKAQTMLSCSIVRLEDGL